MTKFFIIPLTLVFGTISWSQGQNGSHKPITNKVESKQLKTAEKLPFRLAATENTLNIDIKGRYYIERYDVHHNSSKTKKAIKAVGTYLEITDSLISGTAIEPIIFKISHSEILEGADYLYRVFGETPEDVPQEWPEEFAVHKTNNLDCYGIGVLPDGTVIIPYNGLILYLRQVQ
ncbi:hypothetical protein [Crocinitomix algicola]|uniref:hypothetical protein n=1 Tax=Crocinitomix algicola TaxID=1740263 RepID=UPI00082B9DEB|nr:hypothetical protein [Crocinitomix algicola]